MVPRNGVAPGPASQSTLTGANEPPRSVHLVGSLPAELAPDLDSGMRWVLDHTESDLIGLPSDHTRDWILGYLTSRMDHPAFTVLREGDGSDYDHLPVCRVRPGHTLTPEDVTLGKPEHVRLAMQARRRLQAELPAVPPLLVGIPSPLDLAVFTMGVRHGMRHLRVYRAMITAEISEITRYYGPKDVLLQWETPAALYLMTRATRGIRGALAQVLARQIFHTISATTFDTTQWIVHLCHGDLRHQALFAPATLDPAVRLTNALAKLAAREGFPMPRVHIPMAYGDQPPPRHRGFYAPLQTLADGVPLIAGLVDEQHPMESETALRRTEHSLGRRVDGVAAACGHGRRGPADTLANITLADQLAAS